MHPDTPIQFMSDKSAAGNDTLDVRTKKKKVPHRHSSGEHDSTDDSVHKQSVPGRSACTPGHM